MKQKLDEIIEASVAALRAEGFSKDYVSAAAEGYRADIEEQLQLAAERKLMVAASPLQKFTSVSSESRLTEESIGWTRGLVRPNEQPSPGMLVIDT